MKTASYRAASKLTSSISWEDLLIILVNPEAGEAGSPSGTKTWTWFGLVLSSALIVDQFKINHSLLKQDWKENRGKKVSSYLIHRVRGTLKCYHAINPEVTTDSRGKRLVELGYRKL